jgi:hypothetical protein
MVDRSFEGSMLAVEWQNSGRKLLCGRRAMAAMTVKMENIF